MRSKRCLSGFFSLNLNDGEVKIAFCVDESSYRVLDRLLNLLADDIRSETRLLQRHFRTGWIPVGRAKRALM